MTKREIMEELQGCEVYSLQFENLVAVKGDTAKDCYTGKVRKPTIAQWKELWQEYFEQEFGTRNVNALLQQEFGNI